MFRRFKREFRVITDNIPLIGLAAFLCCVGGVLLWISGGSTWFAIRNANDPWMTLSLSGVFIVWLITYGLVGVVLALIWLTGKARICSSGSSFKAFALMAGVYILMLSWYAIFFCTRLMLFSVVLLVLSLVLCIMVHIGMRRSLRLLSLIMLVLEGIQIYFIWFSFSVFG